ncbi:winged helix DNA-binding protein [Novosphingobium lentum]|uniref:winged helix DNA-binding protein n=1 Tax=Novosphingobium lentum TaxID=145287 RepID=UPI000A7F489E|nr:winged helix DNA-binding protein [Novosphingobium lentum]
MDLAVRARALYQFRRRRDRALAQDSLFGEPGWDILLDLFIAAMEKSDIQVSSVCVDANVPSTTLLRWIARLEREGLLYRTADEGDGRRRHVRLTEAGIDKMRQALVAIGPFTPGPAAARGAVPFGASVGGAH